LTRRKACGGQHPLGEVNFAKELIDESELTHTTKLCRGVGIEVAITAPHATKRNVNIGTEVSILGTDGDTRREFSVSGSWVSSGEGPGHF
jgi:hypothetical protein